MAKLAELLGSELHQKASDAWGLRWGVDATAHCTHDFPAAPPACSMLAPRPCQQLRHCPASLPSSCVVAHALLVIAMSRSCKNIACTHACDQAEAHHRAQDEGGDTIPLTRTQDIDKILTVKTEGALQGKYVGLYFSAHWCGPCEWFTRGYTERGKGPAGYGSAPLRTWCGIVKEKAGGARSGWLRVSAPIAEENLLMQAATSRHCSASSTSTQWPKGGTLRSYL
jgi:hypothetical protein